MDVFILALLQVRGQLYWPEDCQYNYPKARGEAIHRIYSASWFIGPDSVHDSFSPSFDTAQFTV